MSTELDPAYRLVHITCDTNIPISNIIDAVHKRIGAKLLSGNTIESIRKDETGYVFLIRRPEHANKLLVKGRIEVNSQQLSVVSVMAGSRRLIIRNLPLFATEDDVRKSLTNYGSVRFVRSGLVVDDIRNGTFTAGIVFEKKVPKKISFTSHGRKYYGVVIFGR